MAPSNITYALARPTAPGAPAGPGTAAGQAQAVIGPQLTQQDLYAAHQNAVIQSFARSLLGQLKPVAGQVGGDYDKAIQQIQGLSGQASQYLNAQNPTASQTALGNLVGAPPEQMAQQATQLGNTFRGGAGVLAFTGGVVPGSELAGDKAAAMSQARTLPAIGALEGQQSLASAMWQQGQNRAKIEATRPGLVASAQRSIDTNANALATRTQRAQEFNITEGDKRAALNLSAQKFNIGEQDKTQARNDRIDIANARTAQQKTAAQASARSHFMTWAYSPATVAQGYDAKTLAGIAKNVYGLDIGKGFTVAPPPPKATTPKIIRDPVTGTYLQENPDGSLTPTYQGGRPTTSTPSPGAGDFTIGNTRYRADGTPIVTNTSGSGSRSGGPKGLTPDTRASISRSFAATAAGYGSPAGTKASGNKWQYISSGDLKIDKGKVGSAWQKNPNYRPGTAPQVTVPYWEVVNQGVNGGLSRAAAVNIVNNTPGYDVPGQNGRPQITGQIAVSHAREGVAYALRKGWTFQQAVAPLLAAGVYDPSAFMPVYRRAYARAARANANSPSAKAFKSTQSTAFSGS